MRIFIIFTVYLLIRVVSPYGYSGVLFMRLNGGEKSGVDYILIGSYWPNIMALMILIKYRR